MARAIGSRAHARISGSARRYRSYDVRSAVGRSNARLISVSSSRGSMTPATLDATLSCSSNTSSMRAIEFLGPQMRAGLGLDQLPGDPQRRARLSHAAFQHVAHAKLASDLPDVDRPALVGERGIARDHEQRLEARQRGRDVLHQAVGKILLLGIAAHVLERQHRDRGLVGKRERRAGPPARPLAHGLRSAAFQPRLGPARPARARQCSSGSAAQGPRSRFRPCPGFPARRPPTCRCHRDRQCSPAARRY